MGRADDRARAVSRDGIPASDGGARRRRQPGGGTSGLRALPTASRGGARNLPLTRDRVDLPRPSRSSSCPRWCGGRTRRAVARRGLPCESSTRGDGGPRRRVAPDTAKTAFGSGNRSGPMRCDRGRCSDPRKGPWRGARADPRQRHRRRRRSEPSSTRLGTARLATGSDRLRRRIDLGLVSRRSLRRTDLAVGAAGRGVDPARQARAGPRGYQSEPLGRRLEPYRYRPHA